MVAFIPCAGENKSDKEFMIELYQQFDRLMYFTAQKYFSDPYICEDIVQDGLVKLIEKVSLLRTMEQYTLAGYIVTTIKNTAIDHLRRQGKRCETILCLEDAVSVPAADEGPTMDALMIAAENAQRMVLVWEKLPKEDRFLLEGKYILGYHDYELAKQLGCQISSIRMKLTRARRKALKYLVEKE